MLKYLAPVILFLSLTGCCVTNAVGRRTVILYPKDRLYAQAAASYGTVKAKGPISKNQHQTRIVKRVTERLVKVAERDYSDYCKGFKWDVMLIEQPTVNAWCMPGGKMAIYTGIMKVCDNEAGLAVVIGHEMAHALLEHGNERLSQGLLLQGFTAASMLALEGSEMSEKEKTVMQQTVGLGTMVGGTLVILKYSRSHEIEADRLGVNLTAAAGYDPAEAPQLWRRMIKLSQGRQPPEFLSTHPNHDTRIDELESYQKVAWPLYNAAPKKYGKGEKLIK